MIYGIDNRFALVYMGSRGLEGNTSAGIVESLEYLVIRNCTNEYNLICSMAEERILCIVSLGGDAC
jgi:hypothetical protein